MLAALSVLALGCNGAEESTSCDEFTVEVTVYDVDGTTLRDDATVTLNMDPCTSDGGGKYTCTGHLSEDINQVSAIVPQGNDSTRVTPLEDCSPVSITLVIMQMVGA